MTFSQFMDENNGKYLVTTASLGAQCVALMRYFCGDVLGIGKWYIPTAKYAYQMFINFPDNGAPRFDKVYNTPTNVPKRGAIMFSRKIVKGIIKWQHVSIFVSGNQKNYISFDQNWPKGRFCSLTNHNYDGCLGWLQPKEAVL